MALQARALAAAQALTQRVTALRELVLFTF
jgi:hypothetical protein